MFKKKSLGQHFLRSKEVLDEIVKVSKIEKDDVVLEIGPGEGVLTEKLLQTKVRVVAIEKDDRLIPELEKKFEKEILSKQLHLIHDDVLETNISDLIKNPYKIIANIPYYITGEILRTFLESETQPESMTLLVQKEVAERIVSKNNKESLLSLSVKIFGDPKYIKTVKRGSFSPPPEVDSAIINIENISKEKLKGVEEKLFFKIIHLGFSHKRKQLLANLSGEFDKEKILRIFENLGINPKVRAEDLSLDTWLQICSKIEQ